MRAPLRGPPNLDCDAWIDRIVGGNEMVIGTSLVMDLVPWACVRDRLGIHQEWGRTAGDLATEVT